MLFDSIANLRGLYSTKKRRSAATNCLRLRRSTDNAESDFGFTALNVLDTAAIITWLGGATGYVTTWYDQSTAGNNATQTDTSKQPTIDTGGVRVAFNGTSQFFVTAITNVPNNQTWSLLCKFVQGSGGSGYYSLCGCMPSNFGGFGFSSGASRTSVARACAGSVTLFTNHTALTSGVVGIAGSWCFQNGSRDTQIGLSGVNPFVDAFMIGSGYGAYPGTISDVAVCGATLTDGEMATLSAGLAA